MTDSGQGEGAREDLDGAEESPFPDIQLGIDWFSRPDPVLQDMVSLANIGPGLPVTLYLSWGIASGHVASSDRFFANAAATVRASGEAGDKDVEGDTDLADAIARRSFDPLAEHMPEAERVETNFRQGYDLTTFMHLSEVHTFLYQWNTWQEHDFMRIRLSAVSGWAYGMMRGSTG